MINNNSPTIQNTLQVSNNNDIYNCQYNGGQNNIGDITTQEAAEMANFSSPSRPALLGYGLVSSPTQQQFGTLGYNPANNNQDYNSNVQSFNPQFTYNRGANPQYNNCGNYNNYNHVYQDQQYVIPGYNPSNSDVLYSTIIEEKQMELMKQMNKELEEYNKNNIYSNYNYYGNFNNPFITEKYRRQQFELEKQAKQNRINFNKKLSSIAYTCLNGEPPTKEYLDSIYNDKTVTISSVDVTTYNKIQKLESCVEISKIEADQYNKNDYNATLYHNSIIDPNSNLIDFLNNAGELYALGIQEEIDRSRRDKSKIYDNSNNYRKYLMKQIERRDGAVPTGLFPNINNSCNALDDGTLQINLPDWMKSKDVPLSEQKYNESKQEFIRTIYNQEG